MAGLDLGQGVTVIIESGDPVGSLSEAVSESYFNSVVMWLNEHPTNGLDKALAWARQYIVSGIQPHIDEKPEAKQGRYNFLLYRKLDELEDEFRQFVASGRAFLAQVDGVGTTQDGD
jgi:hypothetical protein